MPRTDSKPFNSAQFYQSQFAVAQRSEPEPSPSPPLATSSRSVSESSASTPQKKKHICPVCERAFTTSGHLARHSRVHTGERNHKCPFPGCETRCSRQDNLQQHYRIHLSPGSRRSSTRTAIARAMNHSSKRAASQSHQSSVEPAPPVSCPPSLEPARVYHDHPSPPSSPPPLAQATISSNTYPGSHSRGPSSSPEASYVSNHLPPMPMPSSMPLSSTSYHTAPYTPSPNGYHNHTNGFPFTPEHGRDSYNPHESPQYSSTHSMPHINTSVVQGGHHDSPASSSSMSSRHSISHISHPHHQSYARSARGTGTAPPSPASSRSVSSHASGGPPTPNYSSYQEESQYHHGSGMIAEQHSMGETHPCHINTHIDYTHHHQVSYTDPSHRYESPPPVLAPIHDHRRPQYVPHPQSHDYSHYQHHSSMDAHQGSWKSSGIRTKSVSALIR
jgi:zinc finger protein CreA/MIG